MQDVYHKSNYQDFQRYMPADLAIGGDVEASLPDLIEAVKRATTSERKAAFAERAQAVAKMHREMKERDKEAAAVGWDASPVSTARLAAEMWNVIKNEKWALPMSDRIPWARRLWPVTEHYQMLGGNGAAGVGGCAPIAVGAALANKDKGILTVAFQPDGDLMYAPGVLWTAAHHKIPILMLMHNNRCYHQEIMHIQRMAAIHNRPHTHGAHRHRDHRSRHRLRQARAGHGRVGGRADHRSGEARAGAEARDRRSEERPPGAGRRGLPGTLARSADEYGLSSYGCEMPGSYLASARTDSRNP